MHREGTEWASSRGVMIELRDSVGRENFKKWNWLFFVFSSSMDLDLRSSILNAMGTYTMYTVQKLNCPPCALSADSRSSGVPVWALTDLTELTELN